MALVGVKRSSSWCCFWIYRMLVYVVYPIIVSESKCIYFIFTCTTLTLFIPHSKNVASITGKLCSLIIYVNDINAIHGRVYYHQLGHTMLVPRLFVFLFMILPELSISFKICFTTTRKLLTRNEKYVDQVIMLFLLEH